MKIPTKTVVVRDWEALWNEMSDGRIVQVDDMTPNDTRAFNMWARKFRKATIRYAALLSGGVQVARAEPRDVLGRRPKTDWAVLFAELATGAIVYREFDFSQTSALRRYAKTKGYAVKMRVNGDGHDISLGSKLSDKRKVK